MATILTKKSDTASAVPLAADLTNAAGGAELAVNATDKRLFSKTSGGTVVELGTNPTAMAVVGNTTVGGTLGVTGATTLAGVSATTLSASSTVTLSGGTANGVAYLNGSKVVTSGSALTFTGTRLGIGEVSPVSGLTVKSGNGDQATFNNAGERFTQLTLQNNGTSKGAVWVDNTNSLLELYGYSGMSLTFSANGSEGMRLTSTGLGIGTSSPAVKLHVSGGARIADSTNSANYITLGSGNEAPYGNNSIVAQTGGLNIGTVAASTNLLLLTAGTTKATLDSSGNLGLGVTPSAWGSTWKAIQVGMGGSIFARTADQNRIGITANAFFDTAFKYIGTGQATFYDQDDGNHYWYNAPSGTAGNAITFTQAMTLDASGNLGVGETAPSSRLHVSSTSNSVDNVLQVQQKGNNTASGIVLAANDNNGAGYNFIRSQTTGGTTHWQIWGGAATSAMAFSTGGTERARIDSSGNLLVGTTSSTGSKITVNNVGSGGVYVIQDSGGGYSFASNAVVLSGAYYHMQMLQSGTPVGSITSSGSTTQYNTSSDYRLKNITGALTGYKERLMSLQPKQGTWIVDGSEFRGFLAHEFAQPYSSSVIGEKDALDESGNPIYQGMQASSSEVMADLVALVQEQQTIIESLKARLDAANL